ncbi:hypothetical protein ACLGGT_13315 [Roseovarius sp. MS2]|uniref:hypothetical protein n=1 Tax=Roseovarius sp. MS2 TaxID=3390728 RepID=UPI003EDC9CE7
MWCPEGYYSWLQVFSELSDASEQILSLVCLGGEPKTLVNGEPKLVHSAEYYLVKAGFAKSDSEARLITGITSTFLMSKFCADFQPVVASVSGNRITPDWPMFSHIDQLEVCNYVWPLKSDTQFQSLFTFHDENGFDTRALLDRFAFVDPDTGQIKPKNSSKAHLENGLGFESVTARRFEELANNLRDFVVCWPGFPDDEEYRSFLGYIEIDEIFSKALDFEFGSITDLKPQAKKRAVGRPSKRDDAARVYFSHFPDGHAAGGKSWKEALAVVNRGLKVPISEYTLKRAVNDVGQK